MRTFTFNLIATITLSQTLTRHCIDIEGEIITWHFLKRFIYFRKRESTCVLGVRAEGEGESFKQTPC